MRSGCSDEGGKRLNNGTPEKWVFLTDLVMLLKRFYKPDWGEHWRERFSVDRINGLPGHELRLGVRGGHSGRGAGGPKADRVVGPAGESSGGCRL